MLLYYVRHGDPIYDPDSLTPLGHRQAEAVAHRLCAHGVSQVFSSSSNRAMLTAKPTCEMLNLQLQPVEFCHEAHAWDELTYMDEEYGQTWLFSSKSVRKLFASPEMYAYGFRWFDHPMFKDYHYEQGMARIRRETDAFLASLGYEHDADRNAYRITRPNDDRVALFAHQGFGMAFLATVLDIPYPMVSLHFDMTHTGMTVIEFKDEGDGYAIAKALMVSNDSHIYRDGLPTRYCGEIYV